MLVVLLLATAVRAWGLGFGLPAATARPDETGIAGPAVGFLSGDLRPPLFYWPTLFQYLVALAYVLYAKLTGAPALAAFAESRRVSLAPFLYVSRSLSMVFGVVTVWWVYTIGRRLFDAKVGVVAALFLALAFLHVRDSHFGVTDVPMTALVVFAVLLILRWDERGGFGRAAAAGLISGLAGSMKYNGLGTVTAFGAAWILHAVDASAPDARSRRGLAADLLAYCGAMTVGFFGSSPYILIDWSRFLADTRAVRETLAGGHGTILGQGWWYYAQVVLPAAMGWPMFLAGVAGVALLFATRWRIATVLLAFPVSYYVVAGRGYSVFARYVLPIVPFLSLTAAWFVVTVARAIARASPVAGRMALVPVMALLVVAPTAYTTLLLDRLLARPDNRVVTARALLEVIPAGAFFYQTGESYGQIPLGIDGRSIAVRQVSFDAGRESFHPIEPDWVLVQRSPLALYSAVPESLEQVLRDRYELARSFPTGPPAPRGRIYDQQDAFFLPLTKLAGIDRPGPSYELFRKRQRDRR
jgi:hypothetical protein